MAVEWVLAETNESNEDTNASRLLSTLLQTIRLSMHLIVRSPWGHIASTSLQPNLGKLNASMVSAHIVNNAAASAQH